MKNKLVLAAEAIFFSCADAVSLSELAASLGVSKNAALDIALELQKDYDDEKRGVKLIRLEETLPSRGRNRLCLRRRLKRFR